MMGIRFLLVLAAAVEFAWAQPVVPLVDLGKQGNQIVAQAFSLYHSKPMHCLSTNPNAKRVILTGFGPFQGKDNITGTVVKNLQNPGFLQDQMNTALRFNTSGIELNRGENTPEDYGGGAITRALTIDGVEVELCLILLDVIWDLASAILVHELDQFKPDLILMTGIGSDQSARFESHAKNIAQTFNGFSWNGSPLGSSNTPINTFYLLPDLDMGKVLPLSWSSSAIGQSLKPLISSLGFKTQTPEDWQSGNQYICNHLAFIMAARTLGHSVTLAGEELNFGATYEHTATSVGFLHFPNIKIDSKNLDEQNLLDWSQVLLRAISIQGTSNH